MVDNLSGLHTNLIENRSIKKEDKVEIKQEFSVIQAVAAANRELSDRQTDNADTALNDSDAEDIDEDEAARRRRERALVRRPSYRKILTELGGGHHNMISEDKEAVSEGESGGSSEDHQERHLERSHHHHHQQHPHHYTHHASRGLITNGGGAVSGVEPLHGVGVAGMSPTSNGIVQYTNTDNGGPPFYVPSMTTLGASSGSGLGSPPDESSRKREIRLLKNREAARECRRKKKEYIKCLENRVAVLENQNKALIEELKSLKELYTGGSKIM